MGAAAPHEIVFRHLSQYLGPHTARTALRTFAAKALGKPPEQVTRLETPALLGALKPMLRTLLGADECQAVLDDIGEELAL